jgi:hypothetical protein
MYGGMCTGLFAQNLMIFQSICAQNNVGIMLSFMFNESLITRARNAITQSFLKSEATHLLFIDADIVFNPVQLFQMINTDKDIICGIYPKKEINWGSVKKAIDAGVPENELKHHTGSWVVNLVGYENSVQVPINEPLEIWNGGTGMMLIKREVFEKLKDTVPYYLNDVVDLSGSIEQRERIHEFFATSIEPDTERLLSEDYHFCRIWRLMGGKIYAAPWMELGHVGTYVFDGRLSAHS